MPPLLLAPLPPPPPPIVGGVDDTQHPAVGALLRCTTPESCVPFCSASLITPDHALTAAHCADATAGQDVVFALGADADSPDQIRAVTAWDLHPDRGLRDTILIYDVAVITLDTPVDEPAPLALHGDPVNSSWLDASLTYVGFGALGDSGQGAGLRRVVDIPTADFDNEVILGLDPEGTRNVCGGDSGGAALRGDLLAGVISFVFSVDGSLPCLGGGVGASRIDIAADFILSIAPDADIQVTAPPEESDADTDADADTDTDTAGDTGTGTGGGCRRADGKGAWVGLLLPLLWRLRPRRTISAADAAGR